MAKYIIDIPDGDVVFSDFEGNRHFVLLHSNKTDEVKTYKITPCEEKPKRWRAEKGDRYWYLDHYGWAGHALENRDDSDDSDDWRYASGNYFRTKEEAEEYREKLIVYNGLKAYAEPDDEIWDTDISHSHWFIIWDFDKKEIDYNYRAFSKHAGLYFPSKEAAEEAVKTVGLERVKRYYLGIKENEKWLNL